MANTYFPASTDAIIIRRVDVQRVHDYAREHCDLRDYLIIRLPMKIGLRTGEICTFRIEKIDFTNRMFLVLDSKKYKEYPLPLDMVTLQFIKDLVGKRTDGYVFTHKSWGRKRAGKRLLDQTIEAVVENIAEATGVKNFSPRILRHFFAAEWHYIQHKSIELLRRILRHKNLAYTQFYLSRLIFWEDLQREFNGVRNAPFGEPMLNRFYQEHCTRCASQPVCRFIDQMPEWATGCHHFKTMEETRI